MNNNQNSSHHNEQFSQNGTKRMSIVGTTIGFPEQKLAQLRNLSIISNDKLKQSLAQVTKQVKSKVDSDEVERQQKLIVKASQQP